jgi:predicted NAD/FAD-binding protein
MLADIPRFNHAARSFLNSGQDDISLGELLDRHDLSEAFQRHFLLPMGGAIWSSPAGTIRRFSARSFLRFFDNHGWLTLDGAHRWWTIKGGSGRYVDAISRSLASGIHLGTPAQAILRDDGGVRLRVAGEWRRFDRVVLATHANQALRLLADPSPEERRTLGSFLYSRNRTLLHTDARALPRARGAWASWNCDLDCREESAAASLTYHVNRLQSVPGPTQFCVTLNGPDPAEGSVIAEMLYEHPVMDANATRAQVELQALSGARHTYYCGAHMRYGFHEDGLLSALSVAAHFGEELEPKGLTLARAS